MVGIRRREFITLLGGAAAWPLAASAQQGGRVRRIGVLMGGDENDPLWKTFVSAFTQALAGLGWADGRNVRVDVRWSGGDDLNRSINRIRALAQELVGLQPDIIVTDHTTAGTVAAQQETRTRLCERDRSRRHRPRRAARPPEREHHRLRQHGSHVGRQVA